MKAHAGQSVQRREDHGFLTGQAEYTDDLNATRLLHAGMVRSPHAHARITDIDTSPARSMEGIVQVYTAEDLPEDELQPLPTAFEVPGLKRPDRPYLAGDRVRYAGEALAVVLGTDRYLVEDAVNAVQVEYERLDAVITAEEALSEGAPQLHQDVPGNQALEWENGDPEAVHRAFEEAEEQVEIELVNQRLVPNFMEPRGALADFDSSNHHLTLNVSTQGAHTHQYVLSHVLGLPEHKLQVVAPKVGGAFGGKAGVYPDEVLVCWCSMQLGRPVKWISTRTEGFQTDGHGRDHLTHAELAFDRDGTVRGLRVNTRANLGAYSSTFGPMVPSLSYGSMVCGPYTTPAIYCRVLEAYTNTTPTDAYRGAGRPEAAYVVERLFDQAAKTLGMDPAEFRRRNFIPPEDFPYETPLGQQYDNGRYERALDKALDHLDYDRLREHQEELRTRERYLGIGLASFVENTGSAPTKAEVPFAFLPNFLQSTLVRFHPTGTVTAYCSAPTHGQGHQTTYAQLLSEQLGVPYEDIEVIDHDTDKIPRGYGTSGSRSAIAGGSGMVVSARKIIRKARGLAARMLEADERDVEFDDGRFFISGAPSQSVTIQEVVRRTHDDPVGDNDLPGLEASAAFRPDGATFSFGTHVAVVEVDPESGEVDLKRYLAVDDVGNQINPMIVRGQVHGGVAQGIGQALYEAARYDESGNLQTGSMMDYALPRAHQLPELETEDTVTPSELNPLGVKGVGEAGSIAATPAVVNAVVDALSPFGISHLDMPLTPERVWRTIQDKT